MRITARGLNCSTLSRQLLLRRESLGVADAVRRVVALQAQEPASSYLAVWNLLVDLGPADLDAARGGLAAEARSLLTLIAGREPAVYRRYDRRWRRLSDAEIRLLPAD